MPATEYCTTTQVAEEFKDVSFATGPVTTARVTRLIQEASAYINSKVGKIYETPIVAATSPEAYLIMTMICVGLVSDRLKPILKVKTPALNDSQQGGEGEEASVAERMLTEIVQEKLNLGDATKLSSTDGVDSYNVSSGVENKFSLDEDQW
jgi:hypothetical protein